jgi:hypothetical protein
MPRSKNANDQAPEPIPSIVVRHSRIHGNGVFAKRKIAAGELIAEYIGERITEKEALKRTGLDPENPFHTFFFALENGKMIDGGSGGNDLRWINHSCAPNCEAREEKNRIFIHALRDIRRGEELNYDYGLVVEGRHTPALKRAYQCLCGEPNCRQTMLAPKRRARKAA